MFLNTLSCQITSFPDRKLLIRSSKFRGRGTAQMCAYICAQLLQSRSTLRPCGLQLAKLCPQESPGRNTGVGCHAPRQGIFLTQELSLHLLHCRRILYLLNHLGNQPKCENLSLSETHLLFLFGKYLFFQLFIYLFIFSTVS